MEKSLEKLHQAKLKLRANYNLGGIFFNNTQLMVEFELNDEWKYFFISHEAVESLSIYEICNQFVSHVANNAEQSQLIC
jgi:hypothetical protein